MEFRVSILKLIILVPNTLIFFFGLVLIILGAVAIQKYEYLTDAFYLWGTANEGKFGATISLINSGIAVMIISSIGCLGAIYEKRTLLWLYLMCVTNGLGLQLYSGIAAYTFRDYAKKHWPLEMKEDLNHFGNESNPKNFTIEWESIQNDMQCCGVYDYTDWDKAVYWPQEHGEDNNGTFWLFYPESCCKFNGTYEMLNNGTNSTCTESYITYKKGCFSKLWADVKKILLPIVAIAMGFMLIQAILLIGFTLLARNMDEKTILQVSKSARFQFKMSKIK